MKMLSDNIQRNTNKANTKYDNDNIDEVIKKNFYEIDDIRNGYEIATIIPDEELGNGLYRECLAKGLARVAGNDLNIRLVHTQTTSDEMEDFISIIAVAK